MIDSLISIIVACYNKENFIADTIKSVISQDYENWELIIVDDFSNDNTTSVVSLFANKDSRIKLFLNKDNKGANFCRNQGLFFSKGDFVIFLDADDILIESCLKNRLKVIQKERLDFCVFTMGTFFEKLGDSKSLWIPKSKEPLKDFLRHKLPWSILQPIWRKDFLIHIGGFDENFLRLQDIEIHTRALLNKTVKYQLVLSEPDCFYRIEDNRKNFNSYVFLERWMMSSVKYIDKMSGIVTKSYKKYLFGTLLISYQQLVYNKKIKKITLEEFYKLECILFKTKLYNECNLIKKSILKISKYYNSMPLRIPGINMLLNLLIIV